MKEFSAHKNEEEILLAPWVTYQINECKFDEGNNYLFVLLTVASNDH